MSDKCFVRSKLKVWKQRKLCFWHRINTLPGHGCNPCIKKTNTHYLEENDKGWIPPRWLTHAQNINHVCFSVSMTDTCTFQNLFESILIEMAYYIIWVCDVISLHKENYYISASVRHYYSKKHWMLKKWSQTLQIFGQPSSSTWHHGYFCAGILAGNWVVAISHHLDAWSWKWNKGLGIKWMPNFIKDSSFFQTFVKVK